MITQIYEVNDPETARLVEEAGVDNIGVLVGFGEFPRESSVENTPFQLFPPKSLKNT